MASFNLEKSFSSQIYHWLDDEGDERATAKIAASIISSAADARYGTMRIAGDWINQTIQLVGCPRHFGGLQWYFVCPVENRCVSVLWSPPGRRFFAGRKSLGKQVAYLSQYHPPEARAHYRRQALRPHRGPGASDNVGRATKAEGKWVADL